MQTDSSAKRTCFKSRSAEECTATVLIPNSRQARNTRNAISPRFAITTLSSIKFHQVRRVRPSTFSNIFSLLGDQEMVNRGCSNSTGCPFSTSIAVTVPARSDSIGFIIFIASIMHKVSPTLIVCPNLTKSLESGDGAP